MEQLIIFESDTWIGRKLIYGYSKNEVTVIDEDKTHVLIQFDSGTKIATPKNGFKLN